MTRVPALRGPHHHSFLSALASERQPAALRGEAWTPNQGIDRSRFVSTSHLTARCPKTSQAASGEVRLCCKKTDDLW